MATLSARADWTRIEAALFDLDGVLTDTARVHAGCWKELFDAYLRRRADETGEPFVEFEIESDYLEHVDGKPREDGVRDFLASRGIHLPEADPARPGGDTVLGLASRKDTFVRAALARGVAPYPGSVMLVRTLRGRGVRTAVVSASRNCRAVLRAAGIEELFDARVDGVVAADRGLRGKPAPDAFLEAARELDVAPTRAAVVEDALSGVRAGRAGRFALVIGVARRQNQVELAEAGADLVVRDLDELVDGASS